MYLRQRRGQVWNFGPFVPYSPPRVRAFLTRGSGARFTIRSESGLSLTPWRPGVAYRDARRRFCRTVCMALEPA